MNSLYKYYPVKNSENLDNEYSIINLIDNKTAFSTRRNFNDLFDSKVDLIKPNRRELKDLHTKLKGKQKTHFKHFLLGKDGHEQIDKFFQLANEKFDEYLYSCFTTEPDNNLMWSHYANSHKGFCLEWDATKFKADKIQYKDEIASFYILDILKLEYGFAVETEIALKIWDALKTKLTEWKYENEYRVHLNNEMCAYYNPRKEKFALVPYDPTWIKSIIFGCRMDIKTQNHIKDIMPPHIKVKYAVEGKSKVEIKDKRI